MDGVLTNDEAYSWRVTQHSPLQILELNRGDANPPLSYLLQKLWVSVAGDSVVSLRSLSVTCGLAAAMIAIVCFRSARTPPERAWRWEHLCLLGLLLVHPLLCRQFLTARMYALGILFAGLTSLLLIKSFTVENGIARFLIPYGVAAAGFAWTHYYAFFALAGQWVFAGATLIREWSQGRRTAVGSWLRVASWGGAVAVLLYAPWWPIFLEQRRDVEVSFWIPALGWETTARTFVVWGAGIPYDQAPWSILIVWAACIVVLVCHADWLTSLFLVQAAAPWCFATAYSWTTGSSIVYDRYFTFGAYAWVCFIAMSWSRITLVPLKAAVGVFLGGLMLWGFVDEVSKWPKGPPPHEEAAAFLKEHYRKGDVCWVDWAPDVNTLRYYLAMEGMRQVNVRCRFTPPAGRGHVVHLASLSADDVFLGDFPEGKRIWKCGPNKTLTFATPPGMAETQRHTFQGQDGSFYTVVLLERAKEPENAEP